MKSLPFIVAIAALSLGSFVAAAEAAAETKVFHIGKKYSKAELDTICARERGSAYGTPQDIYGCIKGGNIIACNTSGLCAGYVRLSAVTGGADYAPIENWRGNAELVLEMPVVLPKSGLDSDAGTAQ